MGRRTGAVRASTTYGAVVEICADMDHDGATGGEPAVDLGRDRGGVVDDEDVARAEVATQRPEGRVLDRHRALLLGRDEQAHSVPGEPPLGRRRQ